jgi:predicted double-glycine peptidase
MEPYQQEQQSLYYANPLDVVSETSSISSYRQVAQSTVGLRTKQVQHYSWQCKRFKFNLRGCNPSLVSNRYDREQETEEFYVQRMR